MTDWLSTSRRFTTFASEAKSKIRKKLRTAEDAESLRDVALELQTAYLLLQERAFTLEYEPKIPEQLRSPDFAVNFTTHSTFMLEVTRLRGEGLERLAHAACAKLGQLAPRRSNVLLIGVPAPVPTPDALRALMQGLQARVEGGDEVLFKHFGFRDRGDFFSRYRRLSEVLVCSSQRGVGENLTVWVNPQAKNQLSGRVRTALYRSHMP